MFLNRGRNEMNKKYILDKDLIKDLQHYYWIRSIDEQKDYLAIFNHLFVNAHKLSRKKIAFICHVDVKTLSIYYNKMLSLDEKIKKSSNLTA